MGIGSIYHGSGGSKRHKHGVKIRWVGVEIPWVEGPIYHGYGGQNTMGRKSIYHCYGFKIPCVGGQHTVGRGVDMP